jgi:iron complex outermembrane receptor protein
MRIQTLIGLFFFLPFFSFAQECSITVTGHVRDISTNIPLEYATIFVEETGMGALSDTVGLYKIENLCAGEYHITLTHIACDPRQIFFKITKDTVIDLFLNHHFELLDEVVVHGSREENSTQQSNSISRENITLESHKNLSDILEQIAGVSVLRSGTGISKPVVHGMYGNRVAILNNGIQQAGQQWGNDHAPEIDPFVADHLSVVKGAGALAYGGNSLGSVVLVETEPVDEDPHVHGEVNYVFQSNGLGNTLNAKIERKADWAAWRLSGTLKKIGDHKTPDYYLTNTGKTEANLALQLEKDFGRRWSSELYYSIFNTEIGILRGSHVGNLTDLEDALARDVPFFTQELFSYNVEAPRQRVNHHLLKLSAKYLVDDNKVLRFKYGGQLNQRKEFDVRRSDRSDIPALSLDQFMHFFEGQFNASLPGSLFLKTGVQFNFTDNTNNPETGILPLIPDYRAFQTSVFAIARKDKNKLLYELGARYDLKQLYVATITQSLPYEIERFNLLFHNYSLSGGVKFKVSPRYTTNVNLGYMLRAPEVNELFSFGLHQGVSGIEEGTRTLSPERSAKLLWSNDLNFGEKLFIQAIGYFQQVADFIYLQPQSEYRLTIRGAFPVFVYEQTDAEIFGADLMLKYAPVEAMDFLVRYAVVRGKDRINDLYLINMPSDNISGQATVSLKGREKIRNIRFGVNGQYVFQQKNIQPEQDFVLPPDAFFLLGASVGAHIKLKNESLLKLTLNGENLLNERYRDYLNRFRYFSNEPGINVSFNANYTF